MKKTFADILAYEDALIMKKLASKLPEWASAGEIDIPASLSLEQCSSTAAALYKAEVASAYGAEIWDLTGGLGVDSWAFSRYFKSVHYNEINPGLYSAAKTNFQKLEAENIECSCSDCESLSGLIKGDVVYLDPARRSDTGKKVFFISDCRPDVLQLMPDLLPHFRLMMVKLSPMADISLLARQFGGHMREVHIVGLDGECKELLCLLTPQQDEKYRVVLKDLDSGVELEYFSDEEEAGVRLPCEGKYLVEPKALLMKTGRFDLISARFGIEQMDKSTHLYLSDHYVDNAFVKCFRIESVYEFGKRGFESIRREYPFAEVTARNVPLSSEELRKRIGVRPGGGYHIFACTSGSKRLLYVTGKCGGGADVVGTEV